MSDNILFFICFIAELQVDPKSEKMGKMLLDRESDDVQIGNWHATSNPDLKESKQNTGNKPETPVYFGRACYRKKLSSSRASQNIWIP